MTLEAKIAMIIPAMNLLIVKEIAAIVIARVNA
jgi:hypothetical protein